jgi:bifunctional non-homologous end joining protein LigD
VQAVAPGAGTVQAAAVPAQIPPTPGPLPDGLRPMLAATGDPPAGEGWAVEFKWDGIRALAAVTADGPQLVSRNGNDVTLGYPDLTGPWRSSGEPVLLDGEIVALDAAGAPDFGLLQHRMHVRHPPAELMAAVPVQFFVFDVLHLGDRSLLAETYDVRREVLAGLDLGAVPGLAVPPHSVDVPPAQLLTIARAHGLEGVVSKRRRSRYEPGRRSPAWVKTALISTQEVVVGGWTSGKGRRVGSIGALLLGAHDADGALRYLGHVGTGFSDAALTELHRTLAPLAQDRSPFADPIPPAESRAARWVRPVLVGEVVYRRLTHDQRLRHAAWRGLRPDRDADEITMPGGRP